MFLFVTTSSIVKVSTTFFNFIFMLVVLDKMSVTVNEFYFSGLKSEITQKSDSDFICILDVDESHFPLLLNTLISLNSMCIHFLVLALDSNAIPMLEKYKIPYVFSQCLLDSVKEDVRSRRYSPYLAAPMVLKTTLIIELLQMNVSFWLIDTDTFHFRSFPSLFNDDWMSQVGVDIITSAFYSISVPPHHSMNDWHGYFLSKSNTPIIPNNGVAAVRSSERSLKFYKSILDGPKKYGWAQTNFNSNLKKDKKHNVYDEIRPHIYVGYNNFFNVTIALVAAVASKISESCLNYSYTLHHENDESCFHYHALDTGNQPNPLIAAHQQKHALMKVKALKARGFWVLKANWSYVKPSHNIREFLSRIDLRNYGTRNEMNTWSRAWFNHGIRGVMN